MICSTQLPLSGVSKRTSKQAVKLPSLPFQEQEMMRLKQKEDARQHIATADKSMESAIERLLKVKEME